MLFSHIKKSSFAELQSLLISLQKRVTSRNQSCIAFAMLSSFLKGSWRGFYEFRPIKSWNSRK